MTGPSRLLVVRHGETEWNRAQRIQGHLDSPLTVDGRARIGRLGRLIEACRPIAAVYTSDLGRAVATAELLCRRIRAVPLLEVRLRERQLGLFEGATAEECSRRHPEAWRRYRSSDPDYVVPGGESFRETAARSTGFLEEAALRHSGETILVVTHGGVLDALFRRVVGQPLDTPRHVRLWNAVLNVVSYRDGEWTLEQWGVGASGAEETL